MEHSGTKISPTALFSADGLIIVVTGGGSGIGKAMASAACQTGASRVYILGRRLEVITNTAKELDESQVKVVPLQCDVKSIDSVSAAVQHIEKESGYIDVLVNNAGIPNPFFDPESADTIEALQQGLLEAHKGTLNVLDTNLAAIIGISSAFLHLLQKGNVRRGWPAKKLQTTDTNTRSLEHSQSNVDPGDMRTSQIITISSMGGIQRSGLTGLAYTASKAGVIHLGQTLSTMLAPYNIRSNVCIPGYYHSEMTAPLPVMQNMRFGNTPAGRAGDPHDVAGFFLFLVGMSGSFINGAVLLTDGGRFSINPPWF
ncbi:hypothetical protein F4820DRAFT_391711 [Hypoxylon rubiginosum]|uniref:Uncharacterized protein n=1 Tax=Hypoxylon rubiginosum TaxID=110542 RepID=A0ACB9YVJ9_9PEZI|nr:hypothetical protein F4820DRAFT_391711 [Hypoxylon rubiginosum]